MKKMTCLDVVYGVALYADPDRSYQKMLEVTVDHIIPVLPKYQYYYRSLFKDRRKSRLPFDNRWIHQLPCCSHGREHAFVLGMTVYDGLVKDNPGPFHTLVRSEVNIPKSIKDRVRHIFQQLGLRTDLQTFVFPRECHNT